jgi:hypothetical protein
VAEGGAHEAGRQAVEQHDGTRGAANESDQVIGRGELIKVGCGAPVLTAVELVGDRGHRAGWRHDRGDQLQMIAAGQLVALNPDPESLMVGQSPGRNKMAGVVPAVPER